MISSPHNYNGYTNYETWLVAATIDNTESVYNRFQAITKTIKEKYPDETTQVMYLADALKVFMASVKPDSPNLFWQPLMNAVLEDHINFREIATLMVDEY